MSQVIGAGAETLPEPVYITFKVYGLMLRDSPQAVVTSPLFRTLETACGVFGGSPWDGAAQGTPLMHAQSAAPQLRTAHAAIAAAPGPRIVAFEGCRERIGT